MFVEINPADASRRVASAMAAGSGSPRPRAIPEARMKALVTERVGKGVAWMPYHFAGWY